MKGVRDIGRSLEQWQMGEKDLQRRMLLAPTPWERERWYAMLMLAQGWDGRGHSGSPGAGPTHQRPLGGGLGGGRTPSPDFRAKGRPPPPPLEPAQQEELKGAVEQLPPASGLDLANWNWKAVHRFILERLGSSISRSSCPNYLHRIPAPAGFAFKRPNKKLVKADEKKREAFVAEYASLCQESQGTGGRIFFADEAHFRADAELPGKWVLKGEPALVEFTSPKYGEKASYY